MGGSNGELRAIVERIEHLEAEKAEIAAQIKAVYDEAKGSGWLIMAIRRLVRERRRDPAQLAEENALLDLYRVALGMN